ncbi:cytochrome c biogenesis protein CcdA [Methylorubrum extorquens]|nr:cytochrome c biogenesis protein CcdA [Methylorubrum extorquens]MCP1591831.1 cytochrome c biogenesis protein CcdA [Methylorubrum extorquens]
MAIFALTMSAFDLGAALPLHLLGALSRRGLAA